MSTRRHACLMILIGGVLSSCSEHPTPTVALDTVDACSPITPGGVQAAAISTFSYNRAAPLELRDSLRRVVGGISEYAISIASPRGGRAPGLMWVPPGSGPFAGVVLQHWLPGNANDMTFEANQMAALGIVVIALDAPFDRRPGLLVQFTPADSVEQVQAIVDLQRAVDVLAARPDVESNRLGYVGFSYGGSMGALFAGIERRLRTYILVTGDGGFISHYHATDPSGGQLSALPAEQRARWIAAMRPIEPIEFAYRATPASILFQSGLRDNVVTRENARALHAATCNPKTIMWYDADHELNDSARVERLTWLRSWLGPR